MELCGSTACTGGWAADAEEPARKNSVQQREALQSHLEHLVACTTAVAVDAAGSVVVAWVVAVALVVVEIAE